MTHEERATRALWAILTYLDQAGYTWNREEDDFRAAIRTIVETALGDILMDTNEEDDTDD